jgi:threonine synthase
MAYEKGLICLNCGATYPIDPLFDGCPQCRSEEFRANLSVTYDYERLRKTINRDTFLNDRPGIWRFADMLPIEKPSHYVSLHEGNTPLIPLKQVAQKAGLKRLLAKDETRNPTLSYKDRFCAVATAKALDFGAKATTISSTGNHGASAAAYASRAGLNCFVLTVSFTSQNMITLMMVYGGKLVATSTLEGRWQLMEEGIRRYGWFPIGNFTIPPTGNPYGTEGHKTLGYELAEQLNWTSPDWVIVPTAFAEGLYGGWKGFWELQMLGLIDAVPRMIAAAPKGCDPLRVALEKNLDQVPILQKAKTVALSIGTYTTGHQGLVALQESQGEAVSVTDEEILDAQRLLALDGIFAESASATSVAAAIKMGHSGKLDPEATVVCIITASGLKMPNDVQHYLQSPPVVEPDFELYRQALENAYHIHLE